VVIDALREARHKVGLSSDELGDKLGYSGATIRSVESGHRTPKLELAKGADEFFGYPGFFAMMEERLRDLPFPVSYRPFVPHEKAARVLRIFEPTVVTGLLQTPEYARGVLAARPHASEDEVENLLAARLARQEILSGDDPPLVYVLLDEAVLHRQVGTAEVMRDQLSYLVEASRRVNVTLQVIPFSVGPHIGLQGGFTIAETPDSPVIVFLDNVADGQVSENEETVAQVTQRFDALRAEALPKGASRDLIGKVAEERWRLPTRLPGAHQAIAAQAAGSAPRLPPPPARFWSATARTRTAPAWPSARERGGHSLTG
jgi:DNA-binding XRE family transcriptional regulator